jgi:hypothetical protein
VSIASFMKLDQSRQHEWGLGWKQGVYLILIYCITHIMV